MRTTVIRDPQTVVEGTVRIRTGCCSWPDSLKPPQAIGLIVANISSPDIAMVTQKAIVSSLAIFSLLKKQVTFPCAS
jgi:hypothetical protein